MTSVPCVQKTMTQLLCMDLFRIERLEDVARLYNNARGCDNCGFEGYLVMNIARRACEIGYECFPEWPLNRQDRVDLMLRHKSERIALEVKMYDSICKKDCRMDFAKLRKFVQEYDNAVGVHLHLSLYKNLDRQAISIRKVANADIKNCFTYRGNGLTCFPQAYKRKELNKGWCAIFVKREEESGNVSV